MRGESRLERMAADYAGGGPAPAGRRDGTNGETAAAGGGGGEETPAALDASVSAPAADAAEGRSRWEGFLRDRFVAGADDEFDYARVDRDEDLDVQARADDEDRWFDAEEPGWAGEADAGAGETGVQDF